MCETVFPRGRIYDTEEFFYNSSFLANPGRKLRIRKSGLCDVFAVISYIFVSAAMVIFYSMDGESWSRGPPTH